MNRKFKLYQGKIKSKTSRLNTEEKVKYLANELIKSIEQSGKSILLPSIHEGYGSLDIDIFNNGTDKAELSVMSILNGWEITTKPNFTLKEVK